MAKEPEIFCPACKKSPRIEDRWVCKPSCGTVWHTFWTGGVCPGCGHQWTETQCPACVVTSPHKDWYHFPDDDTEIEKVTTEAPEVIGA